MNFWGDKAGSFFYQVLLFREFKGMGGLLRRQYGGSSIILRIVGEVVTSFWGVLPPSLLFFSSRLSY